MNAPKKMLQVELLLLIKNVFDMTSQNKPEWKERFYKQYGAVGNQWKFGMIVVPSMIESFIESLLAERDAEIVKMLDAAVAKYNPWPEQVHGGDEFHEEIVNIISRIKFLHEGYNKGLSDAIKIIDESL